MGEGAAGVVCEFGEEGLGFGFGERSHFLAIGRRKGLGQIWGEISCNKKKKNFYRVYSHVILTKSLAKSYR